MILTDEQRIAWERVNWALDTYGDSSEYRKAWADWVALANLDPRKHADRESQ